MSLSKDLISQFVKMTNDKSKKKSDVTIYGELHDIKEDPNAPGGKIYYVQFDGASDTQLTPVTSTTELVIPEEQEGGENAAKPRVMVTIRNHSAVITGSTTTPTVNKIYVDDVNAKIQIDLEDTVGNAEDAKELSQELAACLATLVTDGNGTSLMTQNQNGWTFSTADIQGKVDSISELISTIQNDVGDTAHTVDILRQAIADIGKTAEYIKITTYNDEPCIELGEGDSDFKLLITNTKIMFMEGSGVPAYFNNQSMFIKKAVIEEELQQGQFVWKARSNGNLGLIWKGGAS